MATLPFSSLRSNRYYAQNPVQLPDQPTSQLRSTIAAKLEAPHGYTALLPTQSNITQGPPRSDRALEISNWLQLGLRVTELIGAIGLLVCTFLLRDMQIEQSYALRVPVLIRNPKTKPYHPLNLVLGLH